MGGRVYPCGRSSSFLSLLLLYVPLIFGCMMMMIPETTCFTTTTTRRRISSNMETLSFLGSLNEERKNYHHRLYSTKKKMTSSNKQKQRTISNLLEWAKENDIQVGGVKVSNDNTVGGLGLVSTRDLKKDDIVIQVPTSKIIQSSNYDDDSNEIGIPRNVYQDAAWWAQLSLQLHSLKQQQTSSSLSMNDESTTTNYEPWLQSLPSQMNTPIHWNDDLLSQMQYSHMIQSVDAQKTLWKNQYQTIVSSSSSNVGLSYEDFVWGCEMARSRAFSGSYSGSAFNPAPFVFTLLFMTVYLGLNMGTLDQAANGAGVVLCGIVFKDFIFPKLFNKTNKNNKNYVICPVIDMANHQSYSGNNNVVAFEYFANAYSLSTKVDDTKKNNELFISYGPRSNDQLLQYYGFVEVDNPHDVYIMPPLREWDIAALEKACGRTFSSGRLQKLDKAGLLGIQGNIVFDLEAENRGGGVVLSRVEGLDPAVLTALRVLVSSDDEWIAAGEAIGNFASENSGGTTNEQLARLAAVTALQQELDSKPTTLEEDMQLLRQMKQQQQTNKNILDNDDDDNNNKEQTQLALEFRMEKKKLLKETIQFLQNSYSSA
jgi:hypothetical protein